jgi:hypothetical protein
MENISIIAGTFSTVIFVFSNLPMVWKAYRTRDLASYSRLNSSWPTSAIWFTGLTCSACRRGRSGCCTLSIPSPARSCWCCSSGISRERMLTSKLGKWQTPAHKNI